MHHWVSKILSEECRLIDDLDVEQMASIPTLAMLANQKFDLEQQLRSMAVQQQKEFEEENVLVTKTVSSDKVYKEWPEWTDAMKSEYNSIVVEKRAVRQLKRSQVKDEAQRKGQKYEELPSKVVFTRKAGGKRKVRACTVTSRKMSLRKPMQVDVTPRKSGASQDMQPWKDGQCMGQTSNVPSSTQSERTAQRSSR